MTRLIDLYSDVVSKPTPAMKKAMIEAEVGDEQLREDPTVNRLCAMVAELLGKEDAVYLPSGKMCNQVAYRVHCQPGDEIILDRFSHGVYSEAGAIAALVGANARTVDGAKGIFTAAQVEAEIRAPDSSAPRSRLVSVEQTTNRAGGAVWPLAALNEVAAVAHRHGLAAHMDGARLMNAVVASGVAAKDFAKNFDSVWIDLSKGLGCPVGAVLAGSKDFIKQAWRYKHQFGGAMRQAGFIAAAGVYALWHHVDRLADDHANAKRLATGLAKIPEIAIRPEDFATNIVFFDVAGTGLSAVEFRDRLLKRNVRVGPSGATRVRCVTHIDVSCDDCETALREISAVVAEARGGRLAAAR